MTKKATLSLFFLGCLCLGALSCGGSGSTESSDLKPSEKLEFTMNANCGSLIIHVVTPTTGIVYYLGKEVSGSNSPITFYNNPISKEFILTFTSAKNWHIDPGPVLRNVYLECKFAATLTPSFENGQTTSGSMEYTFVRAPTEDPMIEGHATFVEAIRIPSLKETGVGTGVYGRKSTAAE